eukprot:scaffold996_cov409-Prasinococcus_capsulatus_cf.AAC.22
MSDTSPQPCVDTETLWDATQISRAHMQIQQLYTRAMQAEALLREMQERSKSSYQLPDEYSQSLRRLTRIAFRVSASAKEVVAHLPSKERYASYIAPIIDLTPREIVDILSGEAISGAETQGLQSELRASAEMAAEKLWETGISHDTLDDILEHIENEVTAAETCLEQALPSMLGSDAR